MAYEKIYIDVFRSGDRIDRIMSHCITSEMQRMHAVCNLVESNDFRLLAYHSPDTLIYGKIYENIKPMCSRSSN